MFKERLMFVIGLLLSIVGAQDILSALATAQLKQYNISRFTAILEANKDVVDLLNGGVHTVLVPTDTAIAAAQSLLPSVFNDTDAVCALLQYHILRETHPSASFSNTSNLVASLLENSTYTNVTGGQRVELLLKDGKPTFLTAVKAQSKILLPDLFFKGGLLHIVDEVLTMPLSFPATITQANLTSLVALLNLGNWLNPNSIANSLALTTPDLTFIGPNNPEFGAGFTGWDGLTQTELDEIFLYHVMPQLVYATDLTNNTKYPTLANESLVARQFTNPSNTDLAQFLDQALITTSNYITANGVLHIVDRPLDPKRPGAMPNQSAIDSALNFTYTPATDRLPLSTVIGIAIGGSIAGLVIVIVFVVLLRRIQKAKQANHQDDTLQSISSHSKLSSPMSRFSDIGIASIATRLHLGRHQPSRVNTRSIESFRTANEPSELECKEYHFEVHEMSATRSSRILETSSGIFKMSRVKFEDKSLPTTPSEEKLNPQSEIPRPKG